jgi:hypothetical protein
LGRLLYRQFSGLSPLEDFARIDSEFVKHVREARSVTYQAASFQFFGGRNDGDSVPCCK